MNNIGVDETSKMTEKVSGIHVFDDSNTASSEKTHEHVHSNTTECTNSFYMNDSGAESPTTSKPTTTIVQVDHTKEFQECMKSYDIGVNTIALAIAFHKCTCYFQLVIARNSVNNYQQYICKQHSECSF